MYIQRRKNVYADDMIDEPVVDGGEDEVVVDPEASDLLFEAEDVAELVAEVTGEPVEVAVEDDSVTFSVGDDDYTVEPEGDEEILEATRRPMRGKRKVSASTRRSVAASRRVPTRRNSRTVRKVPTRR